MFDAVSTSVNSICLAGNENILKIPKVAYFSNLLSLRVENTDLRTNIPLVIES